MNPREFEYHAPDSLDEAFSLLGKYGDESKILAGGQSLIPLMKSRIFSMPHIIDIGKIEGLRNIEINKSGARIGSLVTISDLESEHEIAELFPAIHDAASQIADPLIRNAGTIGGNIAHGDPGNDLPAVLVTLGAVFVLKRSGGERTADASKFFIDTLETDVHHGEILTEIVIPRPGKKTASAYLKAKKSAGDFSIAGISTCISMEKDGSIGSIRMALTSSGPKVIEVTGLEEICKGKKDYNSIAEKVSVAAVSSAKPSDDFYGTVQYKKKVIGILAKDCLKLAMERAEKR